MADFQEYYNLDISQLGKELSYYRASVLCSQLPLGSRLMRETNSELAWGTVERLLALIEYDLRALPAVMFGKNNAIEKVPKPLTPTNKKERLAKKKAEEEEKMYIDGERIEPVTREELAKIFGH